ncbi:MAG: UDP-N-acetylmuramoyl-tripeptide--D-alanyl-D-alanine ligase [Deltaproteobacteria bacterium]|nr:UDP-N-acetylmuramoyl-tripeptide--D-alanyl-D-alanine ligase [Deltaproteobacteria bacterium]
MSRTYQGTESLATAAQIADATKGSLVAGEPAATCTCVCTDSRTPAQASVFVALKGENFDGAKFVSAAVKTGASIVLVERSAYTSGLADQDLGQAAVVVVKDSLKALGDLAAWHRRRFAARVVAITGSNGKTSTKEMTAAVLGGRPTVLFNRGNFNNLIGMPRDLLSLDDSHLHAVMEMGMNASGEIARLAQIAEPQVGVITNVHPVHLEGMGNIEAVARAKAELLEALPGDGTAVLNAEDPHVLRMAGRTRANRVTFGRVPNADVRIVSVEQKPDLLELSLDLQGSSISLGLSRPGVHNAMNAAAAAAVAMIEGVEPEVIKDRLISSPMPALRTERLKLGSGHLLIDCYNANPRSMQAALATLGQLAPQGQRYAILGDMRELGDSSSELHHQVGHAAASTGLTGLCALGPLAEEIADGARAGGLAEVDWTESQDQATDWAKKRVEQAGWVLIKGSRAMRMERIAVKLGQAFGVEWPNKEGE